MSLGRDKDRSANAHADDETGEEVAPELRRYLADEAALHAALARKWLGVDAGEHGGTSKGGIAVGFLIWAKKELEELKSGHGSGGMISGEREKEIRERRKARVQEELESTGTFLVGYKKMNDSVSPVLVFPACIAWNSGWMLMHGDYMRRYRSSPSRHSQICRR